MLRERIKYVDYEGVEHEEDFYFNISRVEVTDLQHSMSGGLRAHMARMLQSENDVEIYALFKEILLKSYGEKTPDGKSFIKIDANGRSLGELFQFHAAFETLFAKLIASEDTMAAFINAVIPKLTPEEQAELNKITASESDNPALTVVKPNRQSVAP